MPKIFKQYVFIVILLHVAIVVPLAYILNIWIDEASTLYTTQKGFVWTLQNAHLIEKQAPLYFSLMSLWRSLNSSIFFARIFSILCSLIAIKIFYDLARKFFDEAQAKFITAFFALHPILIWASLEIRVYALVILSSVLLLKLFFEGFLKEDSSSHQIAKGQKKAQIFYILAAIFALYTNYYLGFLLVGCFSALLVLRRWQAAKTYFWQMFVVLIAILPLLLIIKQQFATNATGSFKGSLSLIGGIQTLWGHFLSFLSPTEIFAPAEITVVSIIRVWIARLGILAVTGLLIKNKFRAIDEKVLIFGTISAVVSAFLLAAYFLIGVEYISIRHASVLFVPVVLFTASILVNILPRKSWIIFALYFALLFPYAVYNLYPNLTKRGDWKRVAEFIQTNEKPNQPVIIFRNYDAITLPFYYTGQNKVLPDERFFDWEQEASLNSENAYAREIEFVISKIPADSNEIWLLTRESCYEEKTESSCRPLENFIEANYTIELEKDFYAEKVRLLRKK